MWINHGNSLFDVMGESSKSISLQPICSFRFPWETGKLSVKILQKDFRKNPVSIPKRFFYFTRENQEKNMKYWETNISNCRCNWISGSDADRTFQWRGKTKYVHDAPNSCPLSSFILIRIRCVEYPVCSRKTFWAAFWHIASFTTGIFSRFVTSDSCLLHMTKEVKLNLINLENCFHVRFPNTIEVRVSRGALVPAGLCFHL